MTVLLCAYCGRPSNEHDGAGASRYWCSEVCFARWRMKQPLEETLKRDKEARRAMGEQSIIGLDLSLTSTGVVVLRDGATTHCGTITSTQRGVLRLAELADALEDTITDPYDLAVIEGYAMGSRAGQAFSIGEWGGVARMVLTQYFVPFIEVPPATLKKFATGNGTAQKDEMRLHVYKRWGFEHKSNDVVDAYALARFGQAYLAVKDGTNEVDGKPLSKADTDIIKRFMEPPKKKRKAVGE